MKLSILLKNVDPELRFAVVPDRCPHCGSDRRIRYGTYRHGAWGHCRKTGKPKLGSGRIQRYRCKTCGRTFSAATNAFGKRIRLAAQFQVFVASFDRPTPVRADAKALGVAPSTVWRWRHRILSYLVALAHAERRVLDGKIIVYTRKFSRERSRWSRHTDIMWRKRGCPLPREGSKLKHDLTFLFAVRFDETWDCNALPFLTLVYPGEPRERALGNALWPHLEHSARVYGIRDLVGWRTTVHGVVWAQMDYVQQEARISGETVIRMRSYAAKMHDRFVRWMTVFRAVRLHYSHRYLEWYYRLELLDASGELPLVLPISKYGIWWWL